MYRGFLLLINNCDLSNHYGRSLNAIPEPGLGDHRWKDGILVQHVDNKGHVYGEGHWLHVGDLQGWSRSTPPHS